jgi:hypothetical protein
MDFFFLLEASFSFFSLSLFLPRSALISIPKQHYQQMWLAARVLSGGVGGGGGGEGQEGGRAGAATSTTSTTTEGKPTTIEHARARALFVVPRDWKPPSLPPSDDDDEEEEEEEEEDEKVEEDEKAVEEKGKPSSSPRNKTTPRRHSIEDDVLTEAGIERLALAAKEANHSSRDA